MPSAWMLALEPMYVPTVGITTTAALDVALLDAAGVRPGARVLDVGCGRGDTTFDAARRVGPSGLALGVDASLTVLERARRRAADAGLAHLGFVHADPQQQRFAPLRFDSIVSRRANWVIRLATNTVDLRGGTDVARHPAG